MPDKYVAPSPRSNGFHCPHCGVYSQQIWSTPISGSFDIRGGMNLVNFSSAHCMRCGGFTIWFGDRLVFPLSSSAPMPAEDMPEDVKADYVEARNIVTLSPRGAAALVRLALQKVMPHLGESGKNLNDDIGNLVAKGLPVSIQQALDSLRVIGNNAVHPGQIDLQDDAQTAVALFELLNLVVEYTVTNPRRIRELYSRIPQGALAQIQRRDNQP